MGSLFRISMQLIKCRISFHRIRCWIQGRFTHDIHPTYEVQEKGEFHPTNQVQVKGKFTLEFHPTNQVQYSVNNLNIPAQGEFG
jgi:hypothetical protein